jgi:DNA modification methylase
MLVDGHLRAETTPEQEVPVLVLDIDEAEADKLLLSLDPLAALAETNAQALDTLLREVDTGSEGLQEMYADLADAAGLYKDDTAEVVEDEVPEPPAEPVTKPGDLWLLGDHRLLCGDSTKAEDVERLMAGERASAVVTDPPYGINANKQTLGTGKKQFARGGNWDAAVPNVKWMAAIADHVVIWGGNYFADQLPPTNDWLCWHKKNDGLSFSEFELAWTTLGNNCRHLSHHWSGEQKSHPTQKPVAVISWCVKMTAGLLFDPFLGSGTTLIAAEQLGRKCYGMEISPQYCDVIVKRWETLTGKKVELEVPNGKTRAKARANDHQDGERQPRKTAAKQARAKARK